MPRKQNGFGSKRSFAFKDGGRTDRGKTPGSYGNYPSVRSFGTTVSRTIFEKYNIDSTWLKWRKGFEIWSKAFYSVLRVEKDESDPTYLDDPYQVATLISPLYQGTSYETNVLFTGWEFPTNNSDVNTHYVAKRQPLEVELTEVNGIPMPDPSKPIDISMGYITEIQNDPLEYPEQFKYGEIWVKGVPNLRGRLLLQMVNERVTDGTTVATVKNILSSSMRPAIYYGKTAPSDVRAEVLRSTGVDLQPTEITLTIPLANITENPNRKRKYRVSQGLRKWEGQPSVVDVRNAPQDLIGKVVYVPQFFKDRQVKKPNDPPDAPDAPDAYTFWQQYGENNEYISAGIRDINASGEIYCLDPGVELLPPSLYDITNLPQIFSATDGQYDLQGTYVFRKADYQRFWNPQYFTANLFESEADSYVYSILPFEIKSAIVKGDSLIITSVPFNSEVQVHPALTPQATLIFSDKSFAKLEPNDNERLPRCMNIDIDPWQDETFIMGQPIKPALTYACSCPSFSKSIITTPQATQDQNTRKVNRQRRYPLPTFQSQDRFFGAGAQSAAGEMSSWEQLVDRQALKLCKHSIAAMFVDGIKTLEPNQLPTVEARLQVDDDLEKEMESYNYSFVESFRRAGIKLTEIVFALAQGLNLSTSETAYVVLSGTDTDANSDSN